MLGLHYASARVAFQVRRIQVQLIINADAQVGAEVDMQWLLLGAIALALLLMASRTPKFAFALLAVLAMALVAAAVIGKRDTMRARVALPITDLRIDNASMTPAYGGGWQFRARIENANAQIAAKEFVIAITMLDCPPPDACTRIDQTTRRINRRIPPRTAREIQSPVSFDAARPQNAKFNYRISEVRS